MLIETAIASAERELKNDVVSSALLCECPAIDRKSYINVY